MQGEIVKFSELKGKKKAFLVVNVASACQLTNQNYRELNKLYEKYSGKALEILCFPCNQFYNREPKCNADIEKYLREHFKPKFKVFNKIDCNGPDAHPLYKFLRLNTKEFKESSDYSHKNSVSKISEGSRTSGGEKQSICKQIPLTFAKFLLDENGVVFRYYEPLVYPLSISSDIETLLKR